VAPKGHDVREHLFLSAFGLGLAYCATPGAVNAEALRRGVARGFWPAFLVQLGSLIGDAVWAAVALTGTAVLVQHRSIQLVLGVAGACFLLRLAWSALTAAWRGTLPEAPARRAHGDLITGAFFSLTNPSAVPFWLGIGGGMIATATRHPQAGAIPAFFSGFMLGAVLWCLAGAAAVAWGRRFVGARFCRWMNGLSGTVLGYFGLRTLWRTLGLLRLGRALLG
jgi:chemosensory pili system protein ChpE